MRKTNRLFVALTLTTVMGGFTAFTAAKAPQGAVPTAAGDGPKPESPAAAPAPTPAPEPESAPVPAEPPADAPEVPKPNAQQDQETSMAQVALGERFAQMARDRLRAPVLTGAMWEESRALLKAASKLSPHDPRYPRLLIEVLLKMQDVDGAIGALNDYRALVPDDRIAQIQLIDLYIGRMETADKKLNYLKNLVGKATIPPEVRSHCAVASVDLLMERSPDDAMEMLENALELFPNSPEALRKKYQILAADAPSIDRAGVLLAMIRSNCAQPLVMTELARLLADEGLAKQSTDWYAAAFPLFPRSQMNFPNGFISEYATQTLMAGQEDAAFALLTAYLKARPDDVEAWFVRLSLERTRGDKSDPALLDGARAALAHRWTGLADRLSGGAAPATQPAAAVPAGAGGVGAVDPTAAPAGPALETIDPAAVMAAVSTPKGADYKPVVIGAAGDIAWFNVYFANDADAASKWVDALAKLLPKESAQLGRLRGWVNLARGKKAEATAVLSPIAGTDALASLGMIRLSSTAATAPAPATKPATTPAAATKPTAGPGKTTQPAADPANPLIKLLSANRSGTLGAILWSETKTKGLRLPAANNAPLISLVQKFPKDLLKILETPSVFYSLKIDPLKLAHKYGEPMFVQVSVRNLSQYDLTIGADGLIHPDLWFDVEFTGVQNRAFPGVTYDRISRAIVLHPGEATAQYVRIDQGPVAQILTSNPSASLTLHCTVLTNPTTYGEGVGAGLGGQQSGKALIARTPFPLAGEGQRRKLLETLKSGNPQEKMAALEMMATYIRIFAAQKQPDPAYQGVANQFYTAMGEARGDQPIVAGICNFMMGSLGNLEQRQQAVDTMAADINWEVRLLAMRAAELMLPPEKQIELAESAGTNDVEPIIKEYAPAMLELAKHPPATQPSTKPAGGEAGTNPSEGTSSLPEDAPPGPAGIAPIGSKPSPSPTIPNVNKNVPPGTK